MLASDDTGIERDADFIARTLAARSNGRDNDLLKGATVNLIRADSINPERINWIWDGWLARGKMHVIAGAAGTGKTTIALALAATITTGGRWPDGTHARVGNVVMWSGEDDQADTLIPRLMAMGADRPRMCFVSNVSDAHGMRSFDPASDIKLLAERLAHIDNVALLIVDPIVSAVAADSHKNGEVRRGLQPLVDLAARHNCALLGITHYTKNTTGKDPLDRVTGSLAFGALARVVFGTANPTKESASCRLVRVKSNIGPKGGGFEYDINQTEVAGYAGMFASRVLWGAAIEGTARELLAEVETEPDLAEGRDGKSALNDAINFLVRLLADGPVPAKEVTAAADAHGHSRATLRRAQRVAAVEVVKGGMKTGWFWKMISDHRRCSSDTEDAHTNTLSTFGEVEHLRQPSGDEPEAIEVEI